MDIGLALPQYDYSVPGQSPLRWEAVEQWSDRAVDAGFTSTWVSDHLFLSLEKYGGPSDRFAALDPIVAMSSIATRHPRLTVGCLVFCVQLRPATILAKQLETLDALAPGRIVAGLGAGWYEPEFEAAGVAFERLATRRRQLVETTGVVRDFLAGRSVPVWFGGKGDRMVDLAARHADGWNTVWSWTHDAYADKLVVLRRSCEHAGRDPATLTLSLGLNTIVGRDDADVRRRWERMVEAAPAQMFDATDFASWRQGRLVGTVEEVRDQAGRWGELGVRLLVANLGALPFSVTEPDDLDLVASALL